MSRLVFVTALFLVIVSQYAQTILADGANLTLPFEEDEYYVLCYFGGYGGHAGTDYDTPPGTPIRAALEGVATGYFQSGSNAYGNYVKITHSDGYETRYAHLDSFASGMGVGISKTVERGDLIGYAGSTGCPWYSGGVMIGGCEAYHLHFEIRINGVAVDPYSTSNWQWCDDQPSIPEESNCYNESPCENCFSPPCGCIEYN